MTFSVKYLALLGLMLVSAVMVSVLCPNISLADERAPIVLKTMVPAAFRDWQEQRDLSAQVVNPRQQLVLDKIYSQTLTRTYINKASYRIMLWIAYGKSQSDALQLHKPEVCYPAQGFQVLDAQHGTLDLLGKPIAATRLETSLGQRHEPLAYWPVLGDHATTGGIDKKLTEMRQPGNAKAGTCITAAGGCGTPRACIRVCPTHSLNNARGNAAGKCFT